MTQRFTKIEARFGVCSNFTETCTQMFTLKVFIQILLKITFAFFMATFPFLKRDFNALYLQIHLFFAPDVLNSIIIGLKSPYLLLHADGDEHHLTGGDDGVSGPPAL